MPLSAQEQYLLELINRGRLNPAAEAVRYGIDLNASLAAGTISTAAKQVLAPNALLETAAIKHSQWMLATDTFSHTGANGSNLGTRASAEGYQWNLVGENIAVWGTSGTLNQTAAIDAHHKGLFLSAGHRTNLMNETLNEVGLAQETGKFAFTTGGAEMNSSMLTELFGYQSGKKFMTGVIYNDTNKDGFYSVGEGAGGATFAVAGMKGTSETAGGYKVDVFQSGHTIVEGKVGTVGFSAVVDFKGGNAKLDIVDASKFLTSATMTVGHGILDVEQLGVADINLGGNGLGNNLLGNSGNNWIYGYDGNDAIFGGNGHDALLAGNGDDMVFGGLGSDWLEGNVGSDYLRAGEGADYIRGGAGADTFVFANADGADTISDFSAAEGDRLMLCWNLWTTGLSEAQVVARYATVTSQGVIFNFGDGDTLTLKDVYDTSALAASILIW